LARAYEPDPTLAIPLELQNLAHSMERPTGLREELPGAEVARVLAHASKVVRWNRVVFGPVSGSEPSSVAGDIVDFDERHDLPHGLPGLPSSPMCWRIVAWIRASFVEIDIGPPGRGTGAIGIRAPVCGWIWFTAAPGGNGDRPPITYSWLGATSKRRPE